MRFQAKIRVRESHVAVWTPVAQSVGGIPPHTWKHMLKFHRFPIH